MFSAVISEHYSKNRVIISVVAAKIWYLKNVQFLLGHPVQCESKKFKKNQITIWIFFDFSQTVKDF